MITKKEIERFVIEIDARIYKIEVLKKELETEIINNVLAGKDTEETDKHFKALNNELKDLKDMKLEAICRYREQFIGNDLTSIRNYVKSCKEKEASIN